MTSIKNFISTVKENSIEILVGLSLFIGLPTVAALYFDYRAGLLALCLSCLAIGVLALRNN